MAYTGTSSQTIVQMALIAVVKQKVLIAVPGIKTKLPAISSRINGAVTEPVATGPPPMALTQTGVAGRVAEESTNPTAVPLNPSIAFLTVNGVVCVTAAATGFTLAANPILAIPAGAVVSAKSKSKTTMFFPLPAGFVRMIPVAVELSVVVSATPA
jgi:hypothetical protein